MERRTSRSASLQKQLAENRRSRGDSVPDLTDFMNDMFFGTAGGEKKVYNLTGADQDDDDRDSFDSSRRSVSSRSTEEWLEEAKRMVAQSPSRNESPSRLVSGSPRFATAHQQQSVSSNALDKRNPLSRSARRHRASEGFGGEILSKSAQHKRNKPQSNESPQSQEVESPTSAVQKWFSNILHPQNQNGSSTLHSNPAVSPDNSSRRSISNPGSPSLPPRQLPPRKSRFQNTADGSQSHLIPSPSNQTSSKRTFKIPTNQTATATNSNTPLDNQLLSPPKRLVESAHRRSISATTCSVPDSSALSSSPPRNFLQPNHRKSISVVHDPPTRDLFDSDRVLPRDNFLAHFEAEEAKNLKLNKFLKEKRSNMEKIMKGESDGKAKIILSGATNSTSSMVAAICYAWLLENRMRADMEDRGQQGTAPELVVPVMSMRRGKMWKQKQAAWLFHHIGIDASALLFSDEVDLETLMMTGKLSILIVGEDILRTKGEVGSVCTIVTDNYCEDAYDLLQIPMLKKLLLAGILLDTHNLNASKKLCTTRDSEAIQLLQVGSSPTYRNTLFEKLMLDQRDDAFSEVLEKNYGVAPHSGSNSSKKSSPEQTSDKISDQGRIVPSADKTPKEVKKTMVLEKVSPKPGKPPASGSAKPAVDSPRGKNVFFLAKWFGFGSK